jgi:hypothetical protein
MAAILGLATAASGAEARPRGDDMLVAQLAQATPAPAAQPSLTTHPPTPLGRIPAQAAGSGSLPRTGADPGLVALAGISLLGAGLAMKVSLRTDD